MVKRFLVIKEPIQKHVSSVKARAMIIETTPNPLCAKSKVIQEFDTVINFEPIKKCYFKENEVNFKRNIENSK